MDPTAKYDQLRAWLRCHQQVAVAFSGGIDSSVLLKAACDTLGPNKVLALFARSTLLKTREIERALQWPRENGFGSELTLDVVDVHPLGWKEFVRNDSGRCYVCKLLIYRRFLERMEQQGLSILLDGTNTDDLKSNRPGRRALHELGIKTPLVEVGFDKADIRLLGSQLRLSNWDHPSSSCLATRVAAGVPITEERLRLIERWEEALGRLGLMDYRVRLEDEDARTVVLTIGAAEFDRILPAGVRSTIIRLLKQNGAERVLLNLEGR
ncbi:ATP-dependent sacrificial sulfur transferase LarE [Desulfobulbus propionicus]